MLSLTAITKAFGRQGFEVQALKGIDLDIVRGSMVAIMGPSGSGKSTLLNIIGLLDQQTSGDYMLDGVNVAGYGARELAALRNQLFGFVIQDFALIDYCTVCQNVAIPLKYSRQRGIRTKMIVSQVLEKLGIDDKMHTLASNLSGGQKQRVALARSLINNPDIILADEPTGSLDQRTGQDVMDILKGIHRDGKTVIIVTHDSAIARQCDRIVCVKDGRIVES